MLSLSYAVATLLSTFVFSHPGNALPQPETLSILRRATPLLPSQDPFYVPPTGYEQNSPGAILRSRALTGIQGALNVKEAYQLLYRTTTALGDPSATVTTVIIPNFANFSTLMAYNFAYDEADWDCSPSYALQPLSNSNATEGDVFEVTTLMNLALLRGIPVSASDYEGEDAAFTAGPQAAYGVLDAIRAAVGSGSITGISREAKTIMFGYSGGSLATEWACEFQATYAPELNIVAAAMGGLPVNLTTAFGGLNNGSDAGLIPTSLLGLAAAYPELAQFLDSSLVPSKAETFYTARQECETGPFGGTGGYTSTFANQDLFTYFKQGSAVLYDPVVESVLASAGVMGVHGIPKNLPLYMFKGTADEIVPNIQEMDALVKKYCDNGAVIEYTRYLNGTHGSTALQGSLPALNFVFDILNGKQAPRNCTTQNVQSVPITK